MEKTLEHFAEATDAASDLSALEGLTVGALTEFGFTSFMMSSRLVAGKISLFGPCNRPHMERYQSERFDLVDPVARQVETSWLPVVWDFQDYIGSEERRCAELFEKSAEVGYERGFSARINGPLGRHYTFVTFYSGGRTSLRASECVLGHTLMVVGVHVARAHHRLTTTPKGPLELTRRERECLIWSSRDKTAWEVSRIIGVAERTVNFHLQNAMAKLETSSKHQAFRKAMALNLLGA